MKIDYLDEANVTAIAYDLEKLCHLPIIQETLLLICLDETYLIEAKNQRYEIDKWCHEIGATYYLHYPFPNVWSYEYDTLKYSRTIFLIFKDPSHAMLFKLSFS